MTDTPPAKPWFVYLVRAESGALYCGISDDPQRRFEQHRSRATLDRLTRELQAMTLVSTAREKQRARRSGATIERHVRHHEMRRWRSEPGSDLGE